MLRGSVAIVTVAGMGMAIGCKPRHRGSKAAGQRRTGPRRERRADPMEEWR